MISPELEKLARNLELDSDDHFALRVKFGLACIERVEHLLTDEKVVETKEIGKAYVSGEYSETDLNNAAVTAAALARSHPGSGSIDGAASAAVTVSHGVAAALAGKALDAAGYAAYASVYSYAGYAVTDISSYETEHRWQIQKLNSLVKNIEI